MITPHRACFFVRLHLHLKPPVLAPCDPQVIQMPRFSSRKHNFISVLVILAQIQTIVAQACHYTDGSEAPTHFVCNSTASFSHCCTNLEACLTNGLVKQSHRFLYGTVLYPNILLVLLCSGSIHKRWHVYRPFVARQQLLSMVPKNTIIPESFDKHLISLR